MAKGKQKAVDDDDVDDDDDDDDDGDDDDDSSEKPCPWPGCEGTSKSGVFESNRLKYIYPTPPPSPSSPPAAAAAVQRLALY